MAGNGERCDERGAAVGGPAVGSQGQAGAGGGCRGALKAESGADKRYGACACGELGVGVEGPYVVVVAVVVESRVH